ncbi:DUF2232 domain-containing protein [Thiomicrorhabdus sp. ZW0627]|uniref:DUF2232 domain-containing protein n=1 Tax=Thiomicrorhabdus sp. ZW0627 TaxID=3039774 RepID=UPI002436B87E|nr:DUF2232 domain-containing protein [Thiomicrorhabdus sp. ZW0627]MDG6772913.1 DUF2232 domain-containing protein [Thiomicrorhabdus sp. ZW0627]
MLGIAKFVMKGPMQALIAAVLFSALSVWIAPFGMFVGAVIGLVTLRVGVVDGLKLLVWSILANIGLTFVMTGTLFPAWISVIEYMLPVWLMAVVLRNTNSLALSLQLAMIMAGLGVVALHLLVPNPAEWWLDLFNQQVKPLLEASGVEYQSDAIQALANMVTMLLAMFAVALWFSILVMARWWQGGLYHPGQFQSDFYQMALPKTTAYVAVVLAIAGLFLSTGYGIVYDLSGVMVAGLMFQGLAIAHQTVSVKKLHTAWLVALYVLLFLFPQAMLILATIGLLDIWINFRSRWVQE